MELRAEGLDQLVVDHLYNATKGGKEEERVRELLLAGAFAAALKRLHQLCPSLADNQWLDFQLKKQEFVQLASLAVASADGSSGGKEAQARVLQEALGLARRELAPLALHAYCEAYSDFKACMLSLVSGSTGGEDSSGSSSELREFAGMVARAVRQEVGGSDTRLAQLLRYLLLLHQHQHHTGFHPFWWPAVSAQTQQLCGQLLLPQHDALPPVALEPADSRLVVGGVREHDVQALRTSLGCDREEAVTLLRRAEGNAFRGLQDALQAAHIDEKLLAVLADEYVLYRGLEAPLSLQAGEQQQHAASEGMQVDEPLLPQQQQDVRQEAEAQPQQQQRPRKLARKAPAEGKDVAAGAEERLELPVELSQQQLRRLLCQLEHLLASGHADKALKQLEAAEPVFLPEHPTAAFALHRCRFLERLAAAPATGGGTAAALAIVRQYLSPLAQQHPELLQAQLKAALALLLPLPAAAGDGGGSGEVSTAAQKQQQQGVADALAAMRAALRPRCHIREPRLLALMQELLSLHTAHFKLQRCQDKFAADLGIPALRASSSATPTAPASSTTAAAAASMAVEAQQALAAAAGGVQHWAAEVPVPGVRVLGSEAGDEEMPGPGSEEEDEEEEDEEGSDDAVGVPEHSIITVQEFTGLPRHTAIDLLLAHGGDATAVLSHVFP